MNTETQEIALQEVKSSQIHAIGHDSATNTLAIRFKNFSGQPSSVYHYANVSAEQFEEFRKADSIGSYFGKNIKKFPDRFPFRRIS